MPKKEIHPKQSISKLNELVRSTPLTELEREDYKDAVSDFEVMHADWQRLKDENKKLKQQLEQQDNG